jgi:putative tryptophan/tyrosine transport system substrate-binding protein
VSRAQPSSKAPIIGYLGAGTPAGQGDWAAAFVQRLRELGWIEGRNIAIEYRWAENNPERYADIRPSSFGSRSTSSPLWETRFPQ